MIVGQVVDAATGDPVSEAIVRLTMPKYFNNPSTPRARVMTDGEGRFFFADLPAGEYFLEATKDGYAPGMYGARRAWSQSQLLSVAEGERFTDITLRVWKYGVIAGTVVDEAGEPVVGVAVRALMKDVFAGRTRFGNMQFSPELVPATTTDDRGMFRFSQLMTGSYVVLVPSTQTTVPAALVERSDPTVRSDLFFAGVGEVSLLGQPGAQQVGDSALLTLNRVQIPPPSSGGRMTVYPTTYFPAAATASAATPIAIQGGEERTDITIWVRPVPAVRVSGRLVTPDGSAPPRMAIRLTGAAMADVLTTGLVSGPDYVGFETVTGMSDATGRFTLLGVPAGEYVLSHANRFLSRALQQGQAAYWISQPITVGADDLSDLVVMLRPALRIEGRIEYGGANTPQSVIPGIMFETPFGELGQFAVEVTKGATLAFSTVAAGGQYIARPYETGGWFVRSVTLRGKDITDRVFDLQEDATSIVVTYTDRPSKVTGTVTDDQGSTSTTAVVLVFPADSQRWSGYGASPRTLKSALTSRRGVYTIDHLPPGEYYAVAVAADDIDGWKNQAVLETLATQATRLTVAADEAPKTLDLRVKAIR